MTYWKDAETEVKLKNPKNAFSHHWDMTFFHLFYYLILYPDYQFLQDLEEYDTRTFCFRYWINNVDICFCWHTTWFYLSWLADWCFIIQRSHCSVHLLLTVSSPIFWWQLLFLWVLINKQHSTGPLFSSSSMLYLCSAIYQHHFWILQLEYEHLM